MDKLLMTDQEAYGTNKEVLMHVPALLDESGLDPYQFRVLAHLSRQIGEGNRELSQQEMADTCNMKRDTLISVAKSLEEKGFIRVKRRPGFRSLFYLRPAERFIPRQGGEHCQKHSHQWVLKCIYSYMEGFTLKDTAIMQLYRLIDKHGAESIIDAVDIAAQRYLLFDKNGKPTRDSVENFYQKIRGVAYVRASDPFTKALVFLRGRLMRLDGSPNKKTITAYLNLLAARLQEKGITPEAVFESTLHELVDDSSDYKHWEQRAEMAVEAYGEGDCNAN